jgi:hypothetical protein
VTTLDMRAEIAKLMGRIDLDERMRIRGVQESVGNAEACTWSRTADRLEWAMSREGDFRGQATAAQIAERDRKLAAQATAARAKATLLQLGLLDDFEVISDVVR